MAQRILVRDFENQSFSVVLGGQRYRLALRYNNACGNWTVSISQNGVGIVDGIALQEGRVILSGLGCFPASWGGLYLENVDTNVTGAQGLIQGSQRLWFLRSLEVYLQFGTV